MAPPCVAEVPEKELGLTVAAPKLRMAPPFRLEKLSEKIQLLTVKVPPASMAPPEPDQGLLVVLPENVQLVTVNEPVDRLEDRPEDSMAPPLYPVLLESVQLLTVSVALRL